MSTQTKTHLTDKEAAERYAVHRTTWLRWVREGNAPKPVKFSEQCTRWRLADLEAWEQAKVEEGA
ncbi:helix-turn-helix domain-containing protein [Guyparkeria halophila]|uniref:Helix-turn-helix domain-containing protein n=1 Tax=Guyparkeria halophila TaxID=47960 RepID=A0A6I6D398_9GAMM|nr:helix-turn-helix domain-containing protein [Guyparkeria halophila]QGT78403.1 helix-turn-helix domain-containing protein [Guyparkeria halophila]